MAQIIFRVDMKTGKSELIIPEVVPNCTAIHDVVTSDMARVLNLKPVVTERHDPDERPPYYEQSLTAGAGW